jgi:hypothetical protein
MDFAIAYQSKKAILPLIDKAIFYTTLFYFRQQIANHHLFLRLNKKTILMQELLTRLQEQAGLDATQAAQAVTIIKDYVKEKFPMLSGAVDSLFGGEA